MIGRDLDSPFTTLDLPMWWVLSRLFDDEIKSKLLFKVSTTRSSVFSFLFSLISCINKQFHLEYCSCLSISFSSLPTCAHKDLMISYFLSNSFLRSSNFWNMKSTEFFSSSCCLVPLIWFKLQLWAILSTLHSRFFKQLYRISLHTEESNPSVNTSSLSF